MLHRGIVFCYPSAAAVASDAQSAVHAMPYAIDYTVAITLGLSLAAVVVAQTAGNRGSGALRTLVQRCCDGGGAAGRRRAARPR